MDYIGVGVGAVLLNDNNEILLILRNRPPEAGCWSIPGGKVDFFENLEDAIIREVKEEINLDVEIVKLLGVTNHIISDEKCHWVAPNFLVKIKDGSLKNMEPEKHGGVKWFKLDSLPENITITTKNALKSLDFKRQREFEFPKSNRVSIRATTVKDIDFVLKAEGDSENSKYVYQWTREQHISSMMDNDIMHIIIEDSEKNSPVGYMIISGIDNTNRNIELKRVVITEKGKGFGRETLKLVKELSFENLGAHRLWLDVKEHNTKAVELYKTEGFVKEGIMRKCVYYNGRYESMVLMSILEEEYRGRKFYA